MIQRVAVRAIVTKEDKILFLRRANGRPSILGKYELPGGRLQEGEQPEEALRRYLQNDVGISIEVAQLFDAITYVDHDERNIHYTFLVYLISFPGKIRVRLSKNYSDYIFKSALEIQHIEVTESTTVLIKTTHNPSDYSSQTPTNVNNTSHGRRLIIYSDGGSRGNPGPSASGFVVMDENQNVIHEGGVYLGITTNNQAEYHGVRLGLEKALELGAHTVDFRMDSLLVVNQMKGVYAIKNRDLWPINERIRELITKFDKVTFTHVRREFNQLADGMVNKILNTHSSKV